MMKTEFFIAKRYLFSKRNVSFITVISAISVLGVTVGVAAMIIVLSVFNGFAKKVTGILIGFDPHIRIESRNSSKIENYETILQSINALGIDDAAAFTINKGMLATSDVNKVLFIKGVDENKIESVSGIKKFTNFGKFDLSDDGNFGSIIIGFALANQLKVFIGDTITIISPVGIEYSLTQFVEPLTRKFLVKGIYDSDNRDYDMKYAYISIENAQYLFKLGNAVSGIELRSKHINDAENIKNSLVSTLDTAKFDIMTWESDLDGTIQTANRFDGPLHRGESPTDAALDHRGNLYLAGISNSYGSGYDYILLKFGVVTRLELPEYRRRESFEITLVGERERIYEIEVSDDLQLWSRLTTVANTFGRTVVQDTQARDANNRFYRVRKLSE